MESDRKRQHHFLLVHGVCYGAWCWYKVATRSCHPRATASRRWTWPRAARSPGRAEEVPSLEEYSHPLLTALAGLAPEEKAVLVGHSFGGLRLALAMEQCPERVAVAVFVSSLMPAAGEPMVFVFEQVTRRKSGTEGCLTVSPRRARRGSNFSLTMVS
jgi:pimeloyl-ACP methyl ester carboxylesterase